MSDLTTRLRNIKAGGAYSRVRYEAADRIEALERENARLRKALMNIGKTYTADGGRLIHSEKQIAALAKEALA